MTKNAARLSLEKPLLGAVLCCTSISPEDRTTLAEYAQQMGAEHKLDLTSDVTHLLVGSTDTPKYQYVAREREDVKVLRPEWVQAVREYWMEDRILDMNALEAEFCVPPFANLKICITGFDDLNVRAEIANTVRKNGGEYTGDLTKDVTHLIAAEPQGKKFEYATVWQKKVVSLKWYSDTLERKMQLDETKYHPSLPSNEQGIGAWNRPKNKDSIIGKRVRESMITVEPARKLRRTASSKLSSQSENMWGDIVGGNAEQHLSERDVLRPSKSMPVMRQDDVTRNAPEGNVLQDENISHPSSLKSTKYFSGKYFCIEHFDDKQKSVVLNALTAAGAQVLSSFADPIVEAQVNSENSFVIVPHQCSKTDLTSVTRSPIRPAVVTELWLERCILTKAFIQPSDYQLGKLVRKVENAAVNSFTINATGFQSIETLHISKVVKLAGAKYEEVFTPQTSVLVCKSDNLNHTKLFHAHQWQVPVVTERWLWDFLSGGAIPIFDRYLIEKERGLEQDSDNDLHKQFKANRSERRHGQTDHSKDDAGLHKNNEESLGFAPKKLNLVTNIPNVHKNGDPNNKGYDALKERSWNSPLKTSEHSDRSIPKPPARVFDGSENLQNPSRNTPKQSSETVASPESSKNAELVESAMRDLLDMKARAKLTAHKAEPDAMNKKKKRLLGRALSNLSNSSRTSNPRLSRASSVDSLNTDGLGSELAPPSAESRLDDSTDGVRSNNVSIRGRAQTKSSTGHQLPAAIDLSDPNLCRDEFNEMDLGPQLTQLEYEDSEEAIALRQKLAEKRRARAKLGQRDDDPKPSVSGRERESSKKKVIRDDETILAMDGQTGWGGGRRTRRRDKNN